MNLALRKFDMSKMEPTSVIVSLGRRRSGKSFLTRDLMFHLRHIPIGTVICATEEMNPFYSEFVPSICIHPKFDIDIVNKAVARQRAVVMKMREDIKTTGSSTVNPHAFLILDDCLYDASWTREDIVRCLFMNGRHLKMFFLITLQYVMGIPPAMRTNVDYVFIFRESSMQNRKRLYDCYASMFPTLEVFCTVMDSCTENFECLVIAQLVASNKLEDMVSWYKAESHDAFRVCAPSVWDLSEKMKAGTPEDKPFDPASMRRSNKPMVTVNKRF